MSTTTIYYVTWYDEDYDDRRGGTYPVNADGTVAYRPERIPDLFYGRKRLAQEAADRFNQQAEELTWQKKQEKLRGQGYGSRRVVRYEVAETELEL